MIETLGQHSFPAFPGEGEPRVMMNRRPALDFDRFAASLTTNNSLTSITRRGERNG
jgi:hypothetical protein